MKVEIRPDQAPHLRRSAKKWKRSIVEEVALAVQWWLMCLKRKKKK